MSINYVPKGCHPVIPYLTVNKPEKLLEFLTEVFSAKTKEKITDDNNTIMHAEVMIGESMIMLGAACKTKGEATCSLYIYVPDVDKSYHAALKLGAKSTAEPTDQFYGDRSAGVIDEFGNQWGIATHFEDISDEEMEKRCHEHLKKS